MVNTEKALIVTALAGFIRSFLTNDIELLQRKGFEVHCAANINHPGSEGLNNYFKQHNVVFHQVDFSSNKPLSSETIKSYRQLKQLKKKYTFRVVHCHTPIVGVLVREAFKHDRKNGCKVIYTTHGFYFHKYSTKRTWFVFFNIEKAMSKYCDAIITINREDFLNAKKMFCKKVYHINGVGVDTNRFRDASINRDAYRESIGVSKDDIMVLAVGELSKRKNQKVVVEAIGLINNPKIILIHCGNAMNDDATTGEILKIAREKNVRLKLLGLRNDIPQICKCADIGTISSTREGLGLAGIEMLASGLPVVASNVHGILDYMKDGQNGYLARPDMPGEFAKGISKLLDPKVRERMKPKCEKSALPFDISISHKQMEEIYNEVIDQ